MSDSRVPFSTHNFAVVVVRNFDGKWLAVKETRGRGWWLPAGLVNAGETFNQAAIRECIEEANIKIEIKGILRVEHSVYGPTHARMRVVFYAMPIDSKQIPKTFADQHSEEARWVTLEELKRLAKQQPGLRGPELYEWGSFIEKGGIITPMHYLTREDEATPQPASNGKMVENVNKSDFAMLVRSIEIGDQKALEKCVLDGTDINLIINEKLWTPLHLACRLNQEQCARVLLLSGATITNNSHKNRNILHFAAQSTPSIMQMVLLAVSRLSNRLLIINQQDTNGDTPLHFAAAGFGKGIIWDSLILNGADETIQNQMGFTPDGILQQLASQCKMEHKYEYPVFMKSGDHITSPQCLQVQNQHPNRMAHAGFFFDPVGDGPDRCVCFSCGLQLVNWDQTDDPFVDHCKHTETPDNSREPYVCNYLEALKVRNPVLLGFDNRIGFTTTEEQFFELGSTDEVIKRKVQFNKRRDFMKQILVSSLFDESLCKPR